MKLIFTAAMWIVCCICYAQDYPKWLERCEPYRERVQSILIDNGVDPDYYYLMVAESRCTPNARSSAGAQGFWQMTKSTGKHHGCIDLDDIDCATRAASRYILRLESEFKTRKDVIFAWNLGGHNYNNRRKKPTVEAVGLYNRYLRIRSCHFTTAAEKGTK